MVGLKIENLSWPSFSDRVQAEVVAAIRAELAAAINDLANSARHLVLRSQLTAAIADVTEVERAAEALRTEAWATEKVEPQLRVERATVDETATSSVGPAADSIENDTADDRGLKRGQNAKNAIAAAIGELHDRLGGFEDTITRPSQSSDPHMSEDLD
jgi:Tfp pilus assembly major pilin PilA